MVIGLIFVGNSDAFKCKPSIIVYYEAGPLALEGIGVCIRGERKSVSMCSHQVK